MLSWGVVSGATVFVTGEYSFYTIRVLLGFAEAGFFPSIILFLALWFPAKERARIVGLFMAAIALFTVIGGPISGKLLDLEGMAGLHRWQ